MLHELLQPAASSGAESLALVDLFSAECHCGTGGGAAATAPIPPGSKSALSRLCDLARPHLVAADADTALDSGLLRLKFVAARIREAAHLDHTAPSGSGASDSPAAALSVNRDEQRSVRAQLNEPLELAVLVAARTELARAIVDGVALQSILMQSNVHRTHAWYEKEPMLGLRIRRWGGATPVHMRTVSRLEARVAPSLNPSQNTPHTKRAAAWCVPFSGTVGFF